MERRPDVRAQLSPIRPDINEICRTAEQGLSGHEKYVHTRRARIQPISKDLRIPSVLISNSVNIDKHNAPQSSLGPSRILSRGAQAWVPQLWMDSDPGAQRHGAGRPWGRLRQPCGEPGSASKSESVFQSLCRQIPRSNGSSQDRSVFKAQSVCLTAPLELVRAEAPSAAWDSI